MAKMRLRSTLAVVGIAALVGTSLTGCGYTLSAELETAANEAIESCDASELSLLDSTTGTLTVTASNAQRLKLTCLGWRLTGDPFLGSNPVLSEDACFEQPTCNKTWELKNFEAMGLPKRVYRDIRDPDFIKQEIFDLFLATIAECDAWDYANLQINDLGTLIFGMWDKSGSETSDGQAAALCTHRKLRPTPIGMAEIKGEYPFRNAYDWLNPKWDTLQWGLFNYNDGNLNIDVPIRAFGTVGKNVSNFYFGIEVPCFLGVEESRKDAASRKLILEEQLETGDKLCHCDNRDWKLLGGCPEVFEDIRKFVNS